MDRNAKLLAASVALYLIIVILGFPQAAGIGLAVTRLHGCPLFTEFNQFLGPTFGSYQHCNYVTYMPVIVSIVYGIVMFIYHLYALVQALRRPEIGTRMTVAPLVVLTLIGLILTLIGAGLTSGGLYYFCQSNRALMMQFYRIPIRCMAGEATAMLFRGYDPYYDLQGTEATYWLAACAWLILLIITIVRAVADRSDRPAGETFRGVTLIPEKFKKGGKVPETIPSSGGQDRAGMTQFETKVRHLETAA